MSNTASLELCKELYELSDWNEYGQSKVENGNVISYNYSAGYLLRKLPLEIGGNAIELIPRVHKKQWRAWYTGELCAYGDTPEDSLCALAINLHKAGILPISGRDL